MKKNTHNDEDVFENEAVQGESVEVDNSVELDTDTVETEEVSYDDWVEGEMTEKDKIKSLRQKLKESEAKSKEYLDGWQRARADLVNKDKQMTEARVDMIKSAATRIIESILPTLDSFEMAKKNKEAWEKVDANWRVGIEYIFANLENVLGEEGLVKVSPNIGDAFNVATMQAVEEVETDDASKDHTVAAVIQSGYTLNGKELREAKVNVFVKK